MHIVVLEYELGVDFEFYVFYVLLNVFSVYGCKR